MVPILVSNLFDLVSPVALMFVLFVCAILGIFIYWAIIVVGRKTAKQMKIKEEVIMVEIETSQIQEK